MNCHLIRDIWQTVCDYFDADDSETAYVSDEDINRKMQDFCDQYNPGAAWLQDADNI